MSQYQVATILKLKWGFEYMTDLPFLFDSLSIHVVICSRVLIEKRERIIDFQEPLGSSTWVIHN